MGFWSSLKKIVKKAWRAVKATVRAIVKVILEIVYRIVNFVLVWLPIQKKMRIQVFILRDEGGTPLISSEADRAALQNIVDTTIQIYKDRFQIALKSYGKPIIQTLPDAAPTAALDTQCGSGGLSNEFGEAGEYFANNLAGWNLIPIHLGFPITVFIVRNITTGELGCSLGPLTDYLTASVKGVSDPLTIAHEMGHSCGLLHRGDINNLMYASAGNGTQVTWWQKFVVRNSRHCTFW